MTAALVRRWLWTLIRFAISATIVCFATGVLQNTVPRLPLTGQLERLVSRGTPVAFRERRPLPHAATAKVSVVIDVTATDVRGSYTIRLPKGDPAFLQIQQRLADERAIPGITVDGYVGSVGFARRHRALSSEMPRFLLDPAQSEAVITGALAPAEIPDEEISNRAFTFNIAPPWDVDAGPWEVVLRGHGVTLLPLTQLPIAQSDDNGSIVLRFTASPQGAPIRVRGVLPEPSREPSAPPQKSIGHLLGRVAAGNVDVFGSLAYGGMNALPFILFIYCFRHRFAEQQRYVTLAACFAYLFPILGILRALVDAFWISSRTFGETYLGYPSLDLGGVGVLSLAMVASIWPSRVRRVREQSAQAVLDRFAPPFNAWRIAACVIAFGGMAYAIVEEVRIGAAREYYEVAASGRWLAVAILATAAGLVWLTAEFRSGAGAIVEIVVALAVMIGYIELQMLWDGNHLFRIFVMWLFALPVIFATANLIRPTRPRYVSLLMAAGTLFLVWIHQNDYVSSWWIVTDVAWELAQPLTLLLIFALLQLLHGLSDHDEWTMPEDAEREAGTALILIMLTLSARNWLAVVIEVAAGALILRRWLFRNVAVAPDGEAVATISDLIRYNEARRALRQMKGELSKSVASATITFNDYRMKVEALEAYVDELAAKLGGITAPHSALLSSGLPMQPWTRARIAATWALLSAAPWIGIYIYNTAAGPSPTYNTQWLTVIGTAIFSVAQWPLYGFFFGYFYPHIRGNHGVKKALPVFTLIAGPALLGSALTMPLEYDAWTSLTFWALQLFVTLLIVGLFAGDLETLHASGLGWRQLLDVHDLGALTAYASTVIAAIGAAITTFVAAQVPTVLTWTMQYFNAQPPR